MSDLKPCPFCGGTDLWPEMASPAPYGIICNSCKSCGPAVSVDDPDEAIAAWSRRSDLCITRAEADAMVAAERAIWTRAIETYFDATAVMDVETHVAAIRKGETP